MICPHCHKDTEAAAPSHRINGQIKVRLEERQAEWFCEFWSLYPRKVSKAGAVKAWKKAATSEAIKDAIMLGLSAQIPGFRETIAKKNRNYIPHAATWLNGRRWEDEEAAGVQTPAARVIACQLCGDSGLVYDETWGAVNYSRCSCARGQLPGLVVPQGEADAQPPF